MSGRTAPRTISVADAMEAMRGRKYKKAVGICDEILEHMPQNATAICIREYSRWNRGANPDECLAGLQRSLEIAPDSALVRQYMGEILIAAGDTERARTLLLEGMELAPENIGIFREYAEITRFEQETDVLRRMKVLYEKPDFPPEAKISLGFSLAKAYFDLNDAERAMGFADAANAAAGREFDIEKMRTRRADLELYAKVAGRVASPLAPAPQPVQPIFIVGMPRSGTTLVETILSRHADVFPAGEMAECSGVEQTVQRWLRDFRKVDAGVHTMLQNVPQNVWHQNAEQIVEIVRHKAERPFKFFTDKMPHNATRLPLISKLFPEAPIIYLRRHPLDCCLSNYFKRFSNLDFSFRQDWLGASYRDLTETVAISRPLISNPVLDLSYEKLVSDPETETRRFVEFVGMQWDDRFLSPEKSKRRSVMTASRWQVRQPIYQHATDRWKAYAPYLAELIEAMGGMEWIEAEVAATSLAASA